MQSLKDKVVLVTGGGRGLGEAISFTIADAGAHVVVADVRAGLAADVAKRIAAEGGKSSALELDVTDAEVVRRGVREVIDETGRIDALVNNAGVDRTVAIEALEVRDWDLILGTNLRGPFLLSREVLPHMKKEGSGQIINVVSTAAKRAWANASAYHASKWGLLGFSHALHVEARPHGVKVTALICGGMRTPFLLERFPEIDQETLQDPRDVAATVRYVLGAPEGTVIPEIMALPMRETSWP